MKNRTRKKVCPLALLDRFLPISQAERKDCVETGDMQNEEKLR
jgi:hypothetical protein